MIKKIKNFGFYTLLLPVYWLGYLTPKNNAIWIFGAWFGQKYSDNPKYLFEYVNKNHPEIKAIWLTKSKVAQNIILSKGFNCHHPFSLSGLYYSLISGVNIIATSSLTDTHILERQKVTINLWHGIPLKKIMFDDKISGAFSRKKSFFQKIKEKIYPFLSTDFTKQILVTSSEGEKDNLASAFRTDKRNIFVLGSPRLDSFSTNSKENSSVTKILYMPTHRSEGELNITDLLIDKLEAIDEKLRAINCILYIKLHFYHQNENSKKYDYQNIVFVNDEMIDQDIYNFLPNINILITDYSSIYFDFLLTGKPIIFAPFDLENYLRKDRELYYDYNTVTPGPKCKDWNEVLEWIEKFSIDADLYKNERQTIKDTFHKYQDGQNCERVYKEITRLL